MGFARLSGTLVPSPLFPRCTRVSPVLSSGLFSNTHRHAETGLLWRSLRNIARIHPGPWMPLIPALSELAGLRVQVTILEDGTPRPPKLPKGTMVRTVTGPQNVAYQLVHLDHQVSCTRARTNDSWTLADLLIAPSFQGDSMVRLKSKREEIPISIVNLLSPLGADDSIVDAKQGVYFARGVVKRSFW